MDRLQDRLPKRFLGEMRTLLDGEFDAFLESYEQESRRGLRVNTKKLSVDAWTDIAPFATMPVPWVSAGRFYDPNEVQPAKDVYYCAGLYYLQEPSAMTPADRLPIAAGDRVLDLCAAPGGKATALGASLAGTGCLIANDISATRAAALLRNLERAGIDNCVVTAETPEKLARAFPETFDKILVDAPCSGEGMFRRKPAMIAEWEKKDCTFYAPLQREILSQAAAMLKPGGLLLYSTCTFSPLENEENVRYLTDTYGFSAETIRSGAGFSPGISPDGADALSRCVRLWPHRLDGEGHFLALLKKPGTSGKMAAAEAKDARDDAAFLREAKHLCGDTFAAFLEQCALPFAGRKLFLHKDGVYLLPQGFINPPGVRILRSGLLLGTCKNGRFTPSQALAMALSPKCFSDCVSFAHDDVRVRKYLKGETVALDAPKKGWQLVCVDGYPLGWGKASGDMLKNKIDPGWRMQE